MTEVHPLSDPDREALHGKAQRARDAFRICAGLGIAAPIAFGVFLYFTPTEFSAGTAALAVIVGLVLASPFLLKGLDLHRTNRRAGRWLAQGEKTVLTGKVTRTGPLFMVTAGETSFAAWEKSRQLAVEDAVTVEYLALEPPAAVIIEVLRINGEPNPYFESAWRSGPPTA